MKSTLPPFVSVILLLAAAATGCRPPVPVEERPVAGAFPHHSLDDIEYFVGNAVRWPASYESRASMRLESPEQSGTFSATIRQRNADTLLMTISPGFGIEAARSFATRDSLFLHDRIRSRLYFGSVEDATRMFPFPPSLEETVLNLIGSVRPDAGRVWDLETTGNHYVLRSPDGMESYAIDPATWRVTRFERVTPDGTLLEERLFSEFEIIEGFFIPRRVVLRRPLDNLLVNVYHREIRVNPSVMDLRFSVPPGVSRIPF